MANNSEPASPYRNVNWTVTQLREELRQRKLAMAGRKDELIERLEDDDGIVVATHPPQSARRGRPKTPAKMMQRSPSQSRTRQSPILELAKRNKMSNPDFNSFNVVQLREELRLHNLSPVGKKATLMARLKAVATRSDNPFMNSPSQRPMAASSRRSRSLSRGRGRSRSRTHSRSRTRLTMPRQSRGTSKSPSPKKFISPRRIKSKSPNRRVSASPKKAASRGLRALLSIFHSSPRTVHTRQQGLTTIETLKYFTLFCNDLMLDGIAKTTENPSTVLGFLSFLAMIVAAYVIDGPHTPYLKPIFDSLFWYGHWTMLGVMSSIGLGSGAHTFLLYLGPFIARVTTVAHVCQTTALHISGHQPMLCPPRPYEEVQVTLLAILWKVMFETLAWGFGTALGEIPPYFIARGSAVTAMSSGNIKLIDDIMAKPRQRRTWVEATQLTVFNGIKKLGFFGILIFASVPNPVFDLAGFACGYFLIPFSTFWAATFIGKTVFKSLLQAAFVIFVFTKENVDRLASGILSASPSLGYIVQQWLTKQRSIFQPTTGVPAGYDLITSIWHCIVIMMMVYFAVTVVRSCAVLYLQKHKRHY